MPLTEKTPYKQLRYFAYLADDGVHWDYVKASESRGVNGFENPWKEDDRNHDWDLEQRIYRFWSDLPDKNQANYYVFELIRYENILDIDDKGDSMASMPHVYLESVIPGREGHFVENLLRYNPTKIPAQEENRIEFFPKEFPPLDNSMDEITHDNSD